MPASPAVFSRTLRLCYWNAEARVLDVDVMELERHLSRLGNVKIAKLKALDAPDAMPCDLLIIAAQLVPEKDFATWVRGLKQRLSAQGKIWIPALILADLPFDVLSDIWLEAAADNWYFDILAPGHMSSLPIRVANLLRIHDHLHELRRYELALDDVTTKVKMLESQVQGLRGRPDSAQGKG